MLKSCCYACSGARRHDVFDCLDYGRPKSNHRSGQSAEERLAALALALSARPDVDVKDKLGRTPLIVAAAAGDEPVVKYLLERQADPNATDKRGWTALHCAAAYCKTHVCLLLLEQDNIDIEAVHGGGGTALAIAAHAGLEPVVRRLLELGADVRRKNFIGFSSLIMAIDGGHPGISKMLIEYGGLVDDPDNFIGMTALHLATFVADDETLERILRQLDSAGDPEWKAEVVNMKTKFGLTSLHRAVANGHLSTVRLLLAHGADANAREGWKRSYSIAKSIGKVAVAQGPVDPNQMGFLPVLMSLFVDRGAVPLHYAANAGDSEMVALLLASGADARLVMGRNKVSPVDMALKHDANHGVMKVFRCVLTSTDVRVIDPLTRPPTRPSGHISRPKKTQDSDQ